MFARSVDKPFGFILLNSPWLPCVLDQLPPQTTIVYGDQAILCSVVRKFVPSVLLPLGIQNPILVIRSNTGFEELHIPEELFGEARDGQGDDQFYDWIDEKWRFRMAPKRGRQLYVTRAALGSLVGRHSCEDHVERLLVGDGYEVYAPKQYTIPDLVEAFLSADKLIFAEGSALHLFSLARQPHQLSAVIQRRHDLPPVMPNQMVDRIE